MKTMKPSAPFRFRLYITGDAPNSVQALANLQALCQEHLADRHELEIVDVLHAPKRALADGILLTPMLVKLFPVPGCQILGTLSRTQTVLQALGLHQQTK